MSATTERPTAQVGESESTFTGPVSISIEAVPVDTLHAAMTYLANFGAQGVRIKPIAPEDQLRAPADDIENMPRDPIADTIATGAKVGPGILKNCPERIPAIVTKKVNELFPDHVDPRVQVIVEAARMMCSALITELPLTGHYHISQAILCLQAAAANAERAIKDEQNHR